MKKIIRLIATILLFSLFAGCANKEDVSLSTDYLTGVLDATFVGNYTSYIANGAGTREEAEEYHENIITYFTELILYYHGIDEDSINDNVYEAYHSLAENYLKNAKYSLDKVYYKKGEYYADFTVEPIGVFETIYDDVETEINAYNASTEGLEYGTAEFNTATNNYALQVYNLLSPYMDNLTYKEPITLTYNVFITDELMSLDEDSWNEIVLYACGMDEFIGEAEEE